ncbi:MAG TPA: hypothetical protein VF444_01165 [Pseudonocardiaceae bacterium]
MGKKNFVRGIIAAGAASAALLVGIGTAQATVVDHANSTRPFSATVQGTTAHIFRGNATQSFAVITGIKPQPKPPWHKGPQQQGWHKPQPKPVGVSSRAQCERWNGATRWFESNIHATKVGQSSHFDCRWAGPYNRAVVGLGADFH